jgi:hypothetical protein
MVEQDGRTRSPVKRLGPWMLVRSRFGGWTGVLGILLSGLALGGISSCATGPWAEELERSLSADPRYTEEGEDAQAPRDGGPGESAPLTAETWVAIAAQVGMAWTQQAGTSVATSVATSMAAGWAGSPETLVDLEDAPLDLQPYLQDMAQLGILTPGRASPPPDDPAEEQDGSTTAPSAPPTPPRFQPNQAITRREFARWLVATNNALFRDRPSDRLRLAAPSAPPVFQDVPPGDPDFVIIQGLAEAGLIPSPLSGDGTDETFRPDDPLTRETALRWKVPLDLRQALPQASVDAVEQTWGFQDAAQIDPEALPAVLADDQNGEQANVRRAFGFTTLLQPQRSLTRAEAAAMLWFMGTQTEGRSAQDALRHRDRSTSDPDQPDREPDGEPEEEQAAAPDEERNRNEVGRALGDWIRGDRLNASPVI